MNYIINTRSIPAAVTPHRFCIALMISIHRSGSMLDRPSIKRFTKNIATTSLLSATLLSTSGCSEKQSANQNIPAPAVSVYEVQIEEVEYKKY